MSPKAYKHLQVDLGLTQRAMARMMDVSEREVHYWKRDGVEGGPAGLLLALLARGKVTPDDLWELRLEYERLTADQNTPALGLDPGGGEPSAAVSR